MLTGGVLLHIVLGYEGHSITLFNRDGLITEMLLASLTVSRRCYCLPLNTTTNRLPDLAVRGFPSAEWTSIQCLGVADQLAIDVEFNAITTVVEVTP